MNLTCVRCNEPTSGLKPYCLEHILHMPYALEVSEEVDRRRDEEVGRHPMRAVRLVELAQIVTRPLTFREFEAAIDPVANVGPRGLIRAFSERVEILEVNQSKGKVRLRVVTR